MPLVSIILATYNDEKYIEQSVNSILSQTLKDFELIIVDDASTDNTKNILENIQKSDNRVKIFRNKNNRGLPYSLNRALHYAKGKYIARMDGDDISLPDRLQKQYNYMEKHKDVDICGAAYKRIGCDSGVCVVENDSEFIKAMLIYYSPLGHSTWFIRKSFLDKYNLRYNIKFRTSQDYEFLYRIRDFAKYACIQEVLLLYRVHNNSITGKTKGIDKNIVKVQRCILKQLGIVANERKINILNGKIDNSVFEKIIQKLFFAQLLLHNKYKRIFAQDALKKVLKKWYKMYS